jgi:2-polyprenyl-6-methoxyphenol hydroxylase-like FAD-dependent oxidoreductase
MQVTVVGGGVAGAASAIALRRVGAEVTVYEAYEDPAGQVGSFLSLAANGLRGLDVLGCLPQVQRAGFAVPRQRMWSGSGKPLGDVARGRLGDDPLHSVTLMRGDLVAILRAEAVRAGARIVTGQRVDGIAREPLGEADVVVGADGLWSATRRLVDSAAPEPTYAGMYSVSGRSEGLASEPGAFNMIFARRGAFIHLTAPDGSVWWSAQVSAPEAPDPGAIGLDDLITTFRTEPRAVTILRAAHRVDSATLHHVLAPVPHHHDGRFILVGDAAHPVGAGQGASMAIEDAIVLAQQLQRNGSVAAALAAHEQTRRERVDKMTRSASANRDAKTAGPIAAALRNLVMPLTFSRFYERATGWLYTYDPGTLTERTGEMENLHQ